METTERYYSHWRPITKGLPRDHFVGIDQREANARIMTKAGYGANSDTAAAAFGVAIPQVIPMFVRRFPLFDMLRKVPANGVSHTWSQQTSFSQSQDPPTIAETGFVNDNANTYVRQTTNIAIFAERRSTSLKASLAGRNQSLDLMDLEVSGGMTNLARGVQNETLRYQEALADAAHGAGLAWPAGLNNQDGRYDVNGYNGLRYILNNQTPPDNTVQVDVSGAAWTDFRMLMGVRQMCDNVYNKGGNINLLISTTYGKNALTKDNLAYIRYNGGVGNTAAVEIIPGVTVAQVETNQGLVPIITLQGDSVGSYTDGSHTYEDIIGIDTDMVVMPYLGNPEISELVIPTGVNGQLVQMDILYCMYGLAALAPAISLGRVQLLKSTP